MNSIFKTSLKATLFATFLMWFLNIGEWNLLEAIPFILLSSIPIWLVCYISIVVTILPIYSIEKNKLTNRQIFNKYFPYYTIVSFLICVFLMISEDFEMIFVYFLITAFFTASLSWIWLFNKENTPIKIEPKLLQNETKL